MSVLRYSADWHEEAANAAPEERATVADFRFWISDQNVCLHVRGETAFDHVTVPLYGLAEGLTHDWWRIFGGRDRSISLAQFRNGAVMPDIRLSFDGAAFEMSAVQKAYTNPDARFWVGPTEVLARPEAEAFLGTLIDEILVRLQQRGLAGTGAAVRWSRVQASRENADESAFCEAAGALGLNPYNVSEEAAATIEEAGALFEGEALTDYLAGARGTDQARLREWITRVERRSSASSRLGGLKSALRDAASADPIRTAEPPWALGYRRAASARRMFGFGSTRRFRDYLDLAHALGASRNYRPGPNAFGLRVLRSDDGDETSLHLRPHGHSSEAKAQELFSLARGAGDVACFAEGGIPESGPGGRRSVINDLRCAYRQAASRAFAAEFLAPIDEITGMLHDGKDVVAVANEFAVSTEVIERQIENAPRIRAAAGSLRAQSAGAYGTDAALGFDRAP